MEFKTSHGILRHGTKTDVFSKELCKKIRKRLDLTPKQLPDVVIYKIVNIGNTEIAKWPVENAEGCFLSKGKDMGMLCVSKQLPKEFREDKDEKIAHIKEIDVSELKRTQILKCYNVDVGDKLNRMALYNLKEKIPALNLSTFFYTFRLIWFNHRNCKLKKAEIYRLQPARAVTTAIYENVIKNNKSYFELQFSDFWIHKIKPQL